MIIIHYFVVKEKRYYFLLNIKIIKYFTEVEG